MSYRSKFHQRMVMLDLETLDTGPDAVVYEVGLVSFDLLTLPTYDTKDQELWLLHTRDQANRSVSYDTIQWMKKTKGRAEDFLDALATGYHLEDWADQFCELPVWKGNPLVWAQGTDFDFPKLEGMLKEAGRQPPWRYNHKMDLRTLGRMARHLGFSMEREKVPHSALEDCLLQVKTLAHILHFLDSYKTRDDSTETMSDSPESLSVDEWNMSER